MATINSVIQSVRELKPNAFKDEMIAAWISELDGKISLETMHRKDKVSYSYPDDAEVELLVPHPYDKLYELYVLAMIDFYNDEMDRYTNSYIMFNAAYSDWKKYYLRTNIPPATSAIHNFY